MYIEVISLISNAERKSKYRNLLNPVEKLNKPKHPYCKSAELKCTRYRFGMTPRINLKWRRRRKNPRFSPLDIWPNNDEFAVDDGIVSKKLIVGVKCLFALK